MRAAAGFMGRMSREMCGGGWVVGGLAWVDGVKVEAVERDKRLRVVGEKAFMSRKAESYAVDTSCVGHSPLRSVFKESPVLVFLTFYNMA